jgi:hypothetical protein
MIMHEVYSAKSTDVIKHSPFSTILSSILIGGCKNKTTSVKGYDKYYTSFLKTCRRIDEFIKRFLRAVFHLKVNSCLLQ